MLLTIREEQRMAAESLGGCFCFTLVFLVWSRYTVAITQPELGKRVVSRVAARPMDLPID